jgi:hypothetical protein
MIYTLQDDEGLDGGATRRRVPRPSEVEGRAEVIKNEIRDNSAENLDEHMGYARMRAGMNAKQHAQYSHRSD